MSTLLLDIFIAGLFSTSRLLLDIFIAGYILNKYIIIEYIYRWIYSQ